MAEEWPTPPRVIPNFALQPPWTDPTTPEEQEGLAQTALLSGAGESDRAVSQLLARFAGDYVINLQSARG